MFWQLLVHSKCLWPWQCVLDTHNTPADLPPEISCLECLLQWPPELVVPLNGWHPEGGWRGVVIASSPSVALNERLGTEVLQTRPWRLEALTCTHWPCTSTQHMAPANPHIRPSSRAVWDHHGLTVDSHDRTRRLTDRASWDVRLDLLPLYRGHHVGHGLGGGQPVAVIWAW